MGFNEVWPRLYEIMISFECISLLLLYKEREEVSIHPHSSVSFFPFPFLRLLRFFLTPNRSSSFAFRPSHCREGKTTREEREGKNTRRNEEIDEMDRGDGREERWKNDERGASRDEEEGKEMQCVTDWSGYSTHMENTWP